MVSSDSKVTELHDRGCTTKGNDGWSWNVPGENSEGKSHFLFCLWWGPAVNEEFIFCSILAMLTTTLYGRFFLCLHPWIIFWAIPCMCQQKPSLKVIMGGMKSRWLQQVSKCNFISQVHSKKSACSGGTGDMQLCFLKMWLPSMSVTQMLQVGGRSLDQRRLLIGVSLHILRVWTPGMILVSKKHGNSFNLDAYLWRTQTCTLIRTSTGISQHVWIFLHLQMIKEGYKRHSPTDLAALSFWILKAYILKEMQNPYRAQGRCMRRNQSPICHLRMLRRMERLVVGMLLISPLHQPGKGHSSSLVKQYQENARPVREMTTKIRAIEVEVVCTSIHFLCWQGCITNSVDMCYVVSAWYWMALGVLEM